MNRNTSSALGVPFSAPFATKPTIPEFCKWLNGVNIQSVQSSLVKKGILIRDRKGVRPSAPFRDGYFTCRTCRYQGGIERYETTIKERGAKLLYKLYRQGQLPMRNNWDGSHTQDLPTLNNHQQ